ncbi:hypothetical protein ACFS07_36655 [Undibacterium arcticum]
MDIAMAHGSMPGSNHVLRNSISLSNYPYAAAFVERIDVSQGAGVATDNNGHLILSTIFLEFSHGNQGQFSR